MRCAARMHFLCFFLGGGERQHPDGAMCMCSHWRSTHPDGRSGNLVGTAAAACGGAVHCVARWGCIGGSEVNGPHLFGRSGSEFATAGYREVLGAGAAPQRGLRERRGHLMVAHSERSPCCVVAPARSNGDAAEQRWAECDQCYHLLQRRMEREATSSRRSTWYGQARAGHRCAMRCNAG